MPLLDLKEHISKSGSVITLSWPSFFFKPYPVGHSCLNGKGTFVINDILKSGQEATSDLLPIVAVLSRECPNVLTDPAPSRKKWSTSYKQTLKLGCALQRAGALKQNFCFSK